MDTITIICSVAAEFPNPNKGDRNYLIGRKELNLILQAPAWIENTAMFKLLAADGSLKAVTSANRVQAENNPTIGVGADGKAIDVEKPKAGRGRKAKAEVAEAVAEVQADAE